MVKSAYFKQLYRTDSLRLQGYDYSQHGLYYVTICTKDKQRFFGTVVNHDVRLSPIGLVAQDCWEAIPEHFPFVELHAYVIMPNHVHGTIGITGSN